ncbi:SRPBCC domain-containing protein [Streptomyces mirabilis]|uniref:SRPBCC domain-containing protein n=1 Tax=Streptomyces mirabilis TaxID=68239 RepID=UPI002251FB0D|nr:SRPBCC domain-containing protein [Streptomyces mirabilis]MCX5356236.1 SRPBCC domain-containing protein [Streptomyces mirabilis]
MREISTNVDIDAPPGHVWEVLTDFARYPDWNPYIREVTGEVRVGTTLALRTQPAKGRLVNFRARVTAVTEGIELRWAGGLPVPGLFGGDHGFTLSPHSGGTRVTQNERFSGLLVPVMSSIIDRTLENFERMNQPLKEWVEAKASAGAGR